MGHLFPILGRLSLSGCNFGPTISVSEIRQHMPRTVIEGQLAPFTYCRNEEVNIVTEFLRDFEQAKEDERLAFHHGGLDQQRLPPERHAADYGDNPAARAFREIMIDSDCD